jgi:hypothetical protein
MPFQNNMKIHILQIKCIKFMKEVIVFDDMGN